MSISTVLSAPQLAIPTEQEAIARVNRWLHREAGMALHALKAEFDPATFYWHLPIELAYAATGTLCVVGDIYLHAATGAFAGSPAAMEFAQRADMLATAFGM